MMLQKKYTKAMALYVLITVSVLTTSCMSQQQGKLINQEVFSIKTRLDEIDAQLRIKEGDFQGQTHRTQKGMASINSQITSWERKLQVLAGKIDTVYKVLGEQDLQSFAQEERSLLEELKSLSNELRALQSSLEVLWQEKITALKSEIEKPLLERLQNLEKRIQNLEQKQGRASQPSSTPGSQPLRSLKDARVAHSAKQWLRLQNQIPALTAKMSRTSSKEELKFFYGEALFRLGKLAESAAVLSDYLKTSAANPLHRRRAKLILGHTYRLSGDQETAEIYYLEVRAEFPGTAQATVADTELKRLQAP